MAEKMRRHFLRDREAAQLLNEFLSKFKIDIEQLLGSKLRIELIETQAGIFYSINGKPLLALINGTLSPTLIFEEVLHLFPKIVVNMGAVSHICNGADVMAPGVVRIEKEFKANDWVVIVDERHSKPIAITVALTDSDTTRGLKQGKIARNIHYVGDKVWSQMKRI